MGIFCILVFISVKIKPIHILFLPFICSIGSMRKGIAAFPK